MQPFESKWACYQIPLKAKVQGGYDIIRASEMLGYLSLQKNDNSWNERIQLIKDSSFWDRFQESIKNSILWWLRLWLLHGEILFGQNQRRY